MNNILSRIGDHDTLLCTDSNCLGQWCNRVGILWYIQWLVHSTEYMKRKWSHPLTSPNGLNDNTVPWDPRDGVRRSSEKLQASNACTVI
jgi:hypothetical protein